MEMIGGVGVTNNLIKVTVQMFLSVSVSLLFPEGPETSGFTLPFVSTGTSDRPVHTPPPAVLPGFQGTRSSTP